MNSNSNTPSQNRTSARITLAERLSATNMYENTSPFTSTIFILLLANLFQSGLSLQTAPRSFLSVPSAFYGSRTHQASVSPLKLGDIEMAEAISQDAVPKSTFDWNEQWYPVIPVSFLEDSNAGDKPVAISVLGQQLVVWKSKGSISSKSRWSIFDDSCPHRRSPLSTSQVVKNGSTCSLRCRYHGWEFDAAGKCSKIPMNPVESIGQSVNYAYRAGSYPTKLEGGLLWVYLGNAGNKGASQLPEIPLGSIPTDKETAGATWAFSINPISYLSMVENSLDPSHAPFTHEGMNGLTGLKYLPNNTFPMARYDVVETKGKTGGFTLVHTPYQISTAKLFGGNSTTARAFIPPCTLTTAPIPTFKMKIWFIPSTPTETTVLALFQETETKLMKLTKNFPKLNKLLRDYSHFSGNFKDDFYGFQSQDCITMQGQEQRKLVNRNWWDLEVTPSDKGVATFQRWIRGGGGGYGPFPCLLDEAALLQPRELLAWESHGKYCPRCQQKVQQVVALEKTMNRWSGRAFTVSSLSALVACVLVVVKQNVQPVLPAVSLSMALLVATVEFRQLSDWSKAYNDVCLQKAMKVGNKQWKYLQRPS